MTTLIRATRHTNERPNQVEMKERKKEKKAGNEAQHTNKQKNSKIEYLCILKRDEAMEVAH